MKKQMSDILTKGDFRVNGSVWLEGDGTTQVQSQVAGYKLQGIQMQ